MLMAVKPTERKLHGLPSLNLKIFSSWNQTLPGRNVYSKHLGPIHVSCLSLRWVFFILNINQLLKAALWGERFLSFLFLSVLHLKFQPVLGNERVIPSPTC